VSSAAITFCVASQPVFIVVIVYLVIYSVRKLLDAPLCNAGTVPLLNPFALWDDHPDGFMMKIISL
jgi:hypothetical protein